MANTFHHIFFLKKPKNYVDGPVPVYLRITISGKRAEVSINTKVDPTRWQSHAGRMKGRDEFVRKFNSFLLSIESKLHDDYQGLIRDKEQLTATALKNKYTGKSEKQRMFILIFQKHNAEMATLVPKDYTAATLERYKTSLSHTVQFLQWKYKITDIDIRSINYEFIADYDFFLRSVRKCSNNTAVKYIKNFGKIIRICIANEWLDKDPFAKYKARVKIIDKIFLCEEELMTLMEKEFTIKRLNQVKDIFVFSCLTGLAYCDIKKISSSNIVTGIDGKKWLFISRAKNGSPSTVPLLPVALAIMAKYEQDPCCKSHNKLLPVLSNQKMNSYLKEIADICGIQKNLTFHTARHTFATTVTLNNDIPIESVSKMLGHKTIAATEHYAKLSDKKVARDMQSLYTKF